MGRELLLENLQHGLSWKMLRYVSHFYLNIILLLSVGQMKRNSAPDAVIHTHTCICAFDVYRKYCPSSRFILR